METHCLLVILVPGELLIHLAILESFIFKPHPNHHSLLLTRAYTPALFLTVMTINVGLYPSGFMGQYYSNINYILCIYSLVFMPLRMRLMNLVMMMILFSLSCTTESPSITALTYLYSDLYVHWVSSHHCLLDEEWSTSHH